MAPLFSSLVCLRKLRFQQMMKISMAAAVPKLKSFKDIPGPPSVPYYGTAWKYFPIIGEFHHMHLDKAATQLYEQYGPLVRENIGDIKIIHLYDIKDVEKVHQFVHPPENQLRVNFVFLDEYRARKPHLYKRSGILPGNGESWWQTRKTAQRPVSPLKEARSSLRDNDDIIREFVSKLGFMGCTDDFMFLANRMSMELTLKMLFGDRWNVFNDSALHENSPETNLINNALDYIDNTGYLDRAAFQWTRPNSSDYSKVEEQMEYVERFVLDGIEKVKNRADPTDTCVVAKLLKDKDHDELDVLSTAVDLIYTGVDTTAIATSFMLYEIGRNKRIQNLIIKESVNLLPNGIKSPITEKILNEAVYLRAVIKENLRLNPTSTAHSRQLAEDIELSGYIIPKGTTVFFQIGVTGRLEKYFRDSLEFKPERWIKGHEEFEQSSPYAVLSFGLGVRSCIARRRAEQILLIFLLRIFSEYEVKYLGEEMGCVTPFLRKPDRPVRVSFSKHNS